MKVVICPDKFAGTLSATQAAKIMADAWAAVRPEDELRIIPLADGGPGFLEAVYSGLGGVLHEENVRDPLGRSITAQWLEVGDTAYIEAAQACGLDLLTPAERNPAKTHTRGVGQLIDAAADFPRIVVGLGGSATNDGGRGAVEVLDGREIPGLIIAADVECPLLGPDGATYGFAEQKGAAPGDLPVMEDRMYQWAQQAPELAELPGAGASGGLGFGLMLLGGQGVSGAELVLDVSGARGACAQVDLVVTGEGKFDWQSVRGKTVGAVLDVAPHAIVIAGEVTIEDPPVRTYSLVDTVGVDRALGDAEQSLAEVTALAARGVS